MTNVPAFHRTADRLPGRDDLPAGEEFDILPIQVNVMFTSLGASMWFNGRFMDWGDGTKEWAVYDQRTGKSWLWELPQPDFWFPVPDVIWQPLA
ncbi:hypothetical protein [Azospirillum sp. B4]|uniref:hypothetical protein n=1 Tax=Azospirillum sp. B4 TaxID=95605 RepID=UPI0011DE319A|nr:hypothetical protein [Azospirillum sp. B4]